jgi:hypothetical protein
MDGTRFSDDNIKWKKATFPLIDGHDAEVIEVAPNLWLMYYGPFKYFDCPECDVCLAIYEGSLDVLAEAKQRCARTRLPIQAKFGE